MSENGLAIRNDMSLSQLGDVFVASGFFSDARQASQAIVKVLAGRELGFGPIASMTGVYVIQGRISLSANLLAAAIKRTGKYNFIVKQMTDDLCEIEYRERIDGKWETIGNSKFTAADAKRAQTKNMDKYPRNMLYARAMSNGARWYCPDIFGGPIYTPEELGANVNEEGEVVDYVPQTFTEYTPTESDPTPEPTQSGNGHNQEAEAAPATGLYVVPKGENPPTALVSAGICDSVPAASALLSKHVPQAIRGDAQKVVDWGYRYRGYRDADKSVEEAAKLASA